MVDPEEMARRNALVFDLVGRSCTFQLENGKRARGRIVGGGPLDTEEPNWNLVVQGESGALRGVRFVEDEVVLF